MTEPSDRVTAWLRCSMAKPPSTLKKPNKLMSRLPAALMTSPSAPAMDSVKVCPSLLVATAKLVWRSVRLPAFKA